MKLREMVVETAVVPALKSVKREDAIAELLDALVSAGAAPKAMRDELLKAIIKRERKGSTGFGHGVAVPHAKTGEVQRVRAAIGISEAGIDFNALDRQPVHAIFLMLSPESMPEDHLAAMEVIFGALSQDRFRKFLRQARSAGDISTLLEEADAAAPAR
jgi:mannitol/fructose-specific phosphotransferase system IIA component (Ntr-type)